jgi:hypothetical protein
MQVMARTIPFKQADVQRAVKGAALGGMSIGRMEIDPATGRIVIFAKGEEKPAETNEFDEWTKKRAR